VHGSAQSPAWWRSVAGDSPAPRRAPTGDREGHRTERCGGSAALLEEGGRRGLGGDWDARVSTRGFRARAEASLRAAQRRAGAAEASRQERHRAVDAFGRGLVGSTVEGGRRSARGLRGVPPRGPRQLQAPGRADTGRERLLAVWRRFTWPPDGRRPPVIGVARLVPWHGVDPHA